MEKREKLMLESYKRALEREQRTVDVNGTKMSFPKSKENENDYKLINDFMKLSEMISKKAEESKIFELALMKMFEEIDNNMKDYEQQKIKESEYE